MIEALAEISTKIEGKELVFYSCNNLVLAAAGQVSRATGLKIKTYKQGQLSNTQILGLFRTSIIYVGYSLSDGILTSRLEAMAIGAIPIQTCTYCADEWVLDGETRFLTAPNETESIKPS